ncbi:hypothetical protein BLOT_007619 [Blomia tropicalis]|nr:hypothetical protein BLOT_007619 [Blomia tropicalis]
MTIATLYLGKNAKRVQAKIEVPTTTTINNKLETNRPSIRFGQHNHSATDYDYDDMGSDIGYA